MGDWDAVRKDAAAIMASLHHEENHLLRKRRWLARDWPERRIRCAHKSAIDDKCISESFQRQRSEDDSSLFRSVVTTALKDLQREKAAASIPLVESSGPSISLDESSSGTSISLDELPGLSDSEIIKRLPSLIKTIRSNYLSKICRTLYPNRKKTNDRSVLEHRIVRKMETGTGSEKKRVLAYLRKLNASDERPKPLEFPAIPDNSTCVEAAELALSTLLHLPMSCLRVILDLISEKPCEQRLLYRVLRGSNRQSLLSRITKLTRKFLREARENGSRFLPQPLQDALRVISLYARQVQGDDNGLSQMLDAVSPETEQLQSKILSAIPKVHKLSFEQLEAVYETLTQTKRYGQRHPRVYWDPIKRILKEVLYRCTPLTAPESVTNALDMIFGSKPEMLKLTAISLKHLEAEVEALFNLSSELAQLSWYWIENQSASPSRKKPKLDDNSDGDSDGDFDDYMNDYSFCSSQLKIEDKPELITGKRNMENDEDLDSINDDITEVADEAALFAYVLVGRAMKENLAGVLGPSGKSYLGSGIEVFGGVNDEPAAHGRHEGEANMVFALVKQMAVLPESVVNSIECRLEEFKQQYDE